MRTQSKTVERVAVYTRHALTTYDRQEATRRTREEMHLSPGQARRVADRAETLQALLLPWRVLPPASLAQLQAKAKTQEKAQADAARLRYAQKIWPEGATISEAVKRYRRIEGIGKSWLASEEELFAMDARYDVHCMVDGLVYAGVKMPVWMLFRTTLSDQDRQLYQAADAAGRKEIGKRLLARNSESDWSPYAPYF